MIKTFADKRTEEIFTNGKTNQFPSDFLSRAVRKLDMIDAAHALSDLRVPPGNRLHALQGDRLGKYVIAINGQWRISFRFEGRGAYDVEICDYHRDLLRR